ncbi:MAG TPA: 2Fe-2S iron-sulfur cluster-binding protein [Burkholderiaceae bacterium]|nr:2Fe-2S iron-sulfur cluster-binding protein [Burkholderiaceae bacterium]
MSPQSYRIRFHPGSPEDGFEAPADLTVLRASLREGGGLLSSCRAGTCRACMRRLLSGRIEYLIEWPGLSAEEKAEGWFLPCVARPCSDLLIEVLPEDGDEA